MGAALSCSSGARNLLNSAGNGDSDTIREVLSVRPELVACTTYTNGQNVAHIAAAKGDRECLQAVVDVMQSAAFSGSTHGSGDIAMKMQTAQAVTLGRQLKEVLNARTNSGQTPLMLACAAGHVSCVNFLLNSGAEPFLVDKLQRRSAIHYAAAAGQSNVLKALLSDSQLMHTEDGMLALKNVRIHDMSGQCRYIDCRAENGVTALHLAAIQGELACVMVLLGAGASMMVRTVDLDMHSTLSIPSGSTPLHLAAQKGQVAIIQAMLQAHADALGNWASEDGGRPGRRGWEQDGRIDLRSVANSLRQLPYHVAWQRGFRQAAQVLNPTIAIDAALENVRELDQGFGAQKLATLAAYAIRKNLLAWLGDHKSHLIQWEIEKQKRENTQRVIAQQRRKEALKLHSPQSVEYSLKEQDARLISPSDAGHTFSLSPPQHAPQAGHNLSSTRITEHDETLSPASWAARLDGEVAAASASRNQEAKGSLDGGLAAGRSSSLDGSLMGRPPSASKGSGQRGRRRLQPVRPAPPPPNLPRAPSASEKALAIAEGTAENELPPQQRSRGHRRGVSWGQNLRTTNDGEPMNTTADNPAQAVAFESDAAETNAPVPATSPFASPFATPFAASATIPDRGSSSLDGDNRSRINLAVHPSGVDLTDPPQGTVVFLSDSQHLPLSGRRSSLLQLSFSRKSSKKLGLQRVKSSKKSFTGNLEGDSTLDFQRAVSIPGFDDNLDEDCGICLDETVNVGITGCSHKLCVDCAVRLCQVSKKPPLCPFCRIHIESFHTVGTVSDTPLAI